MAREVGMDIWFSCEPTEGLGVFVHTGDVDEVVNLDVFLDDSLIDMPEIMRTQYAEKLEAFVEKLRAT